MMSLSRMHGREEENAPAIIENIALLLPYIHIDISAKEEKIHDLVNCWPLKKNKLKII